MDSDLAWVNGKSGRQSWRYHADAFQRSIISEAIYHFTCPYCYDSWEQSRQLDRSTRTFNSRSDAYHLSGVKVGGAYIRMSFSSDTYCIVVLLVCSSSTAIWSIVNELLAFETCNSLLQSVLINVMHDWWWILLIVQSYMYSVVTYLTWRHIRDWLAFTSKLRQNLKQRRSTQTVRRFTKQYSSLQITNRSFTYASPFLWNQLPSSFRQPHSVHSPPGSPCTSLSQILSSVVFLVSFGLPSRILDLDRKWVLAFWFLL